MTRKPDNRPSFLVTHLGRERAIGDWVRHSALSQIDALGYRAIHVGTTSLPAARADFASYQAQLAEAKNELGKLLPDARGLLIANASVTTSGEIYDDVPRGSDPQLARARAAGVQLAVAVMANCFDTPVYVVRAPAEHVPLADEMHALHMDVWGGAVNLNGDLSKIPPAPKPMLI